MFITVNSEHGDWCHCRNPLHGLSPAQEDSVFVIKQNVIRATTTVNLQLPIHATAVFSNVSGCINRN